MRNAVLHLITNKAADFDIEGLPINSAYTPFATTAEEDAVRTALHINDAPYYLINSLSAVYAFNDILSEFRETERTFDLHKLPWPRLTISNASYANTADSNFNIANIPTSFPSTNYFSWTISYNDGETLVIQACDKRFTVDYTLTEVTEGANTYNVLAADWPAETGIKGGFALDVHWSSGNSIELVVPPVVFPYNHAVNKVIGMTATNSLLTKAGLSRNFYNAQSSIEKYALLMLALAQPGIRNPL